MYLEKLQESWTAKIYRVENMYVNEKMAILQHFSARKYNKTSFVTNLNGTLLVDLPVSEMVSFEIVLEFFS